MDQFDGLIHRPFTEQPIGQKQEKTQEGNVAEGEQGVPGQHGVVDPHGIEEQQKGAGNHKGDHQKERLEGLYGLADKSAADTHDRGRDG